TLVATGFNGLSTKRESNLSLFTGRDGRKASETKREEPKLDFNKEVDNPEFLKKTEAEPIKKDDDVWDIPTFLRKKRK
ncbi:MAG: hypothetical protein AAB659_00500, partial [Patescibacteria group bacterium]